MRSKKQIALIVPLFFLVIAIFFSSLPYGFYTFLRLIVFISALFYVCLNKNENKYGIATVFILIAILFNSAIPVHLTRNIWFYIDLIISLFYLTMFFKLYKENSEEKSEDKEGPLKDKNPNEKSRKSEINKNYRERIGKLKRHYSKYVLIDIAIGVLLFALVTVFSLKPVEVTAINLNHSSLETEVYESTDLTVIIEPANVSKSELIWKSNNPQVIQVSDIGRLVSRQINLAL